MLWINALNECFCLKTNFSFCYSFIIHLLFLYFTQTDSYSVMVKHGLGSSGKLSSTFSTLNIYTRLDDHGIQYTCVGDHPAFHHNRNINSSITLSVLCMLIFIINNWFNWIWYKISQERKMITLLLQLDLINFRSAGSPINWRIQWRRCDYCWWYFSFSMYQSGRESTCQIVSL